MVLRGLTLVKWNGTLERCERSEQGFAEVLGIKDESVQSSLKTKTKLREDPSAAPQPLDKLHNII
ncbi:hypothetical protein EC55P2_00096 [Enterococcus phage EC55P2]|nr:hypothetical protein EC55P2_00096 [Enterococcus phage EC55P2]